LTYSSSRNFTRIKQMFVAEQADKRMKMFNPKHGHSWRFILTTLVG